jgi:erythromycin esterase
VTHLESARSSYVEKKVPAKDVEWAIQNARVVLQGVQSRAGEVPRDRSMAENVRWILEQNPKAKIVLWAHNGHVATGGYRGYVPMGVDLRKMYGDQMAVFGFAFAEGSFQAVESGKGLRDFSVPVGPEGSLDATLAGAKLPLFALDLRQLPKNGPVALWFAEPHASRTVGAIYSEDRADAFWMSFKPQECFDALLFVAKTTAARKNPGR